MERKKFTREFKLEAVKLITERGVKVALPIARRAVKVAHERICDWLREERMDQRIECQKQCVASELFSWEHAPDNLNESEIGYGDTELNACPCAVIAYKIAGPSEVVDSRRHSLGFSIDRPAWTLGCLEANTEGARS